MIPIPPPWVWFGGLHCEEAQLSRWLGAPPSIESWVDEIRRALTDDAVDSFEQHTGLSPNPELVALADEYWRPFAEPVAQAQWQELRSPSVLWYSEHVTCVQAWGLRHGRQPELDASLLPEFQDFLEERRRIDGGFREQFGVMMDAHEDAFEPLALSVLPR